MGKEKKMRKEKLVIGDLIITEEPEHHLEVVLDGALYMGYRPVMLGGDEVGRLFGTSSQANYCSITKKFTQTKVVKILETKYEFPVAIKLVEGTTISISEFLKLLKNE